MQKVRRNGLVAAEFVHPAHHPQAGRVVQRDLRLPQQLVGAFAAGAAGGGEPHCTFADPDQQGSGAGGQGGGGMGDGVPGSSSRQATPPRGMTVRTPSASTATKEPSSTSSRAKVTNSRAARS